MIEQSEAKTARAAPGYILVQRDEVSEKIGNLYIPNHYREHTMKAYARVHDVHPEAAADLRVADFFLQPGDYIVLAPSAMKKIVFGYVPGKETELWAVRAHAVICRIVEETEVEYADEAPGDARAWAASHGPEKDGKVNEADPRALR